MLRFHVMSVQMTVPWNRRVFNAMDVSVGYISIMKMSTSVYFNFSHPHLQFFCTQCLGNKDGYNFAADFARTAACKPDFIGR